MAATIRKRGVFSFILGLLDYSSFRSLTFINTQWLLFSDIEDPGEEQNKADDDNVIDEIDDSDVMPKTHLKV